MGGARLPIHRPFHPINKPIRRPRKIPDRHRGILLIRRFRVRFPGGAPGRHLVQEVAQHLLKAVSTPTAHAVVDEPVWVCTIHAPVTAPPASGTNLRTGPTAGSAHRTRPSDLDTRRVGLARQPWLLPSAASDTAPRPHTAPKAVPVEDRRALNRAYRPEIRKASLALTMLTLGTIEHPLPRGPTSARRESPRSMPGG